jgi:hypothetical protein
LSDQHKAFLAYRDAKHQAEKSMLYEDAQRAADAWIEFINCRLPPEHQIAVPAPLQALYNGETLQ